MFNFFSPGILTPPKNMMGPVKVGLAFLTKLRLF